MEVGIGIRGRAGRELQQLSVRRPTVQPHVRVSVLLTGVGQVLIPAATSVRCNSGCFITCCEQSEGRLECFARSERRAARSQAHSLSAAQQHSERRGDRVVSQHITQSPALAPYSRLTGSTVDSCHIPPIVSRGAGVTLPTAAGGTAACARVRTCGALGRGRTASASDGLAPSAAAAVVVPVAVTAVSV